MPTLSSLLVAREIATMRTVEEAIARQVLHGGDLATNLLEVANVAEQRLTEVVAESFHMEPAPVGKLPPPAPAVLRAIPGELALRHGIFPLQRDGRSLVLATSEPLPASIEEDMSFAMDLTIVQRVAPLVRIREAIAEHYGIPLDRRFLRLIAKLEGRPDPSPSSLPPNHRIGAVNLPRPASVPPATFGSGVPGSGRLPPGVVLVTKTQPAAAPEGEIAVVPIPRAPAPPVVLTPTPVAGVEEDAPSPPEAAAADTASGSEPPRAPPNPAARALAGWLRRALIEARTQGSSPPPAKDEPAKVERRRRGRRAPVEAARGRRKGPYTLGALEGDLSDASSTDAVLDSFFAFARQFFEYSALFVVHGDIAEGRDAAGSGADAARVRAIGVPLDLPSMLAVARDRRAPIVAAPQAEGLDTELARDLARADAPTRDRAVVPVVVRSRAVAMLLGDDGQEPVRLESIGEVIASAGLAAAALERLVVTKKRGVGPRPVAVGSVVEAREPLGGADALARAIAGAAPPPAANMSPKAASVPPPPPGARLEDASPVAVDGVSPAARSMRPGASWPPADSVDSPAIADDDSEDTIGKVISRVVEAAPPLPQDMVVADKSAPADGRLVPGEWAATGARVDTGASPQPPRSSALASPSSNVVGFHASGAGEPLPDGRSRKATLRGFARASEEPPAEREPPRSAPRGLAPKLEARSRTPTYLGDPLPKSPPPNAVSTPSPLPPLTYLVDDDNLDSAEAMPLGPPPATAAAVRPLPAKPLPREEMPSTPPPPRGDESPDVSALVASSGSSPAPRAPVVMRDRDPHRTRPWDGGPLGDSRVLPTVIVDVSTEYHALFQRLIEGGPNGDEAFAALVRQGELVMPAVAASFPGPLRVDRHRARDHLPAASQCGPILELVVALRRTALAFVTVRTTSPDPDTRFWATHVLAELRYPEASNAVLPRLFDDEPSVRRIARRAAAALVSSGTAGEPVIVGLDHLVRNADEAIPRRVLAIETMGEIKVGAMVPPLVAVLADPADDVSDAARRALLLVARQDFGKDARRWAEWWSKNAERQRIEWLIDALMHEVPSIRRAAGDELKQLTKEYFGYYDDLPKKERERAQTRYREWWEREGRERFR